MNSEAPTCLPDDPFLRELSGALCGVPEDQAREVLDHVAQLIEENVGFVNEVLHNYEQLNLVFDVAQGVARGFSSREIERTTLARIGEVLNAAAVCCVEPDGQSKHCWSVDDACRARCLALAAGQAAAHVQRVRQTRKVSATTLPDQHVLLAPLARVDREPDVVLVTRPGSGGEFTSADMLVTESTLSFAGQLLSNIELHERLGRLSLEVVRALVSAIDQKDQYTCGHSERVGSWARLIGVEMGLPQTELERLKWAGLLHDVGKIGIPEHILNKPGKLSEAEFAVIQRHPGMGFEILKPVTSLENVLDGVLYHHECPDGSGYPEGLRGDEIPLLARILHVADVFDALTSSRSYRGAFSREKACEIIRSEAGTKLDPPAVEAFQAALESLRHKPEEFAALLPGPQEDEHANR